MSQALRFSLDGAVDATTWLDEVDSTNRYLLEQTASDDGHAVLCWNQTAGRGRLQREWVSAPHKSLAMSVELWRESVPDPSTDSWRGSIALLAGASLADAIRPWVDAEVSVKWPNDVLVGGDKVAGILGEIASPSRVILGVGLNVWLDTDELPTTRATSLSLHGLRDESAVEVIVRSFVTTLKNVLADAGDGLQGSLMEWVSAQLGTIGQDVRVDFPDGTSQEATALGVDQSGRLLVRFAGADSVDTVDAADIWHLRPSAG